MKLTTCLSNLTTLLAFLIYAQYSMAQSPSGSTNSPSKASDKVDLKKLEDKYWSAKDDEYGVIQNRTFSKTGKFYASLVYGPLINDSFIKSRAGGLMLGYYLNEDFGLEASYLAYDSKKNETVSEYENLQNPSFAVTPNYNLLKSTKALSISYTPFYAKMAFMNKSILYFDMGFTLGIGMTDYEIQKVTKDAGGFKTQAHEMKSAPHFEIGLMQQLFLSRYFAFRLDIKNTIYQQKVQAYEISNTTPESARTETSKNANDTTISFGLTVFTN